MDPRNCSLRARVYPLGSWWVVRNVCMIEKIRKLNGADLRNGHNTGEWGGRLSASREFFYGVTYRC